MSWTTIAAVYFVLWWLVLFVVLPWGIRSQVEHEAISPGTDPGAPIEAGMARKLVWTTIIAALIFGAFYAVYANQLVNLDDLATLWGIGGVR
ncbi:MAG: DUF1467 family protein [Proteobacteria bacterium]|nr:DUF1467 family protein [Pseudomonadota bacterium]